MSAVWRADDAGEESIKSMWPLIFNGLLHFESAIDLTQVTARGFLCGCM